MLMARDGLNQQQLAERIGVDQTTVSARLRGVSRWSVEDLRRLAILFQVHPGVFFGDPKDFTPVLDPTPPRPEGPSSTKWKTTELLQAAA